MGDGQWGRGCGRETGGADSGGSAPHRRGEGEVEGRPSRRRRGPGPAWGFLPALLAASVACASPAGAGVPPEVPGAAGLPGGDPHTAPSAAPVGDTLLPVLDAPGRRWVDSTLASLSLREAAGQLIFQWIPGSYTALSAPEFQELEGWVAGDGIGGVAVSIGTPLAYAHKLNALQRRARVPLLVTSDFENGGPGMRINHTYALPTLLPQGGGTSFPPTMAFGAIRDSAADYTSEMARITAVEARAVGVHLNFAPVLDVNSNPTNPIINTRAFGEDPRRVAELGAAYIRGARAGGILTTAKHFPGHGDTESDSHLDLPAVVADRARLDTLELVPFVRAIEEGVDAVMTAHVAVPAMLGPQGPPATFSPRFLTGLLREEMGFQGLLFTDALRMGAITDRFGGGEAAVLALEAGADVVLIPADVGEALRHLVEAVETGRVTRERVDNSVRRILEAKARVGLHRERTVSLEGVGDVVGSGPHLAFADRAAERSIVLVRDDGGRIPIGPGAVDRVVSVTYSRFDDLTAGRAFDARAAGYGPVVQRVHLHERVSSEEWAAAARTATAAELVLVNVYLPPRAGAGSVAVSQELEDFVRRVSAEAPVVVTSFGSPYVLSRFPDAAAALVAWGDREVSQVAGARALFGESRIDGVLPTSVPPLHARGEGLVREAVRSPTTVRTDQLDETGIVAPGRRPPPDGGEASTGAPLGEVPGAEVGMSDEALDRIDALVEAAIREGATPGAALVVGRGSRVVRLRGYGRLGWDEGEPSVDPRTTLYDLASLTKVVGTTSAVMLLVDRGALELDAPVVRYLPDWGRGDPRKGEVTIRHLLLHRSGLAPFRRWYTELRGKEAFVQAIQEEALEVPAGTRTAYSDIGFMTLGLVVEAVSGRSLDRFLQEELWAPLGMTDTGFLPDPAQRPRIAPTEEDPVRGGIVRGLVHDENAWAMGGVAGHAGLFSTAADLARFVSALREAAAGTAGPEGVLPSGVVDRWTRRADQGSTRALGWDTPSLNGSSAGDYFSTFSFGHTGFTGTSIWVDRERDLWVVLLTNRVHPTRENALHVPLRRAVHDAAARAVTDMPVTRRER